MLPTTVHLTVLDGAKTVDGLILVEPECLTHLEVIYVQSDGTPSLFTQKHTTAGGVECKTHHVWIKFDDKFAAFPGITLSGDLHLLWLGGNHQTLRGLSLHDVYDTRREELNFHVLRQACDSRQTGC